MAQQKTMSLLEFMERFGTEELCHQHLYDIRWPERFVCPKCGVADEPFNIKSRKLYQCKHCNHQASVTAGTVMDKTKTSLHKWFLGIYLMSQDKRGCSAKRLQRELGIAYDTAWTMSHKIRKAMGEKDAAYLLGGTVDMDEAFFGAAHVGSKRGRGTEKTAIVFGVSMNNKGKPGFIKAKVAPTVDSDTVSDFAKEYIEAGSRIRSDGLTIYRILSKDGYAHEAQVFDPIGSPEHLKILHIIISNVKAFINGTYHGLGDTHLQAFIDEFCYRFNRRFWESQLFNRTINACVGATPFPRYELIG